VRILFKVTSVLLEQVRDDLLRPHSFAAERVGFVLCKIGKLNPTGVVILAHSYHVVADQDYLDDETVGAMMGAEAIRKAMQLSLSHKVGMFHVHMHDHLGWPAPSSTDRRETARFVPDFWNVTPEMPHGALILSRNSLSGRCWYPNFPHPIEISELSIVGPRLVKLRAEL
jgi:hypothetical protein